jgi:hypothetical protein
VAAEFDINVLPFYRIKGQEWPQLPGLMAATPPKRAARGREEDQLLIYLTLSGNTPYTSAEYTRIMSQLAERFYQTAGSLTSAIRATADALNQFLLNRNLTTTGKGQYIIGRLILGVLRGGQFIFAQSGPTHVFHLTSDDARQVHDPQIEGRGLGIGQTTPIYFAQADLHHGDLLILCSNLPAGWDSALLAEHNGAPESLRRKLYSITGEDLSAVLIQTQAGKGNMNILKGGARPAVEKPVQTPTVDIPASPPLQAKRPAPKTSLNPAPVPASNPEQTTAVPVRHASKVDSGRPASRFAHLIAGTSTTPPDEAANSKSPGPVQTTESQPVLKAEVRSPHRPTATTATQTVARPAVRSGRFISPRQGSDIPEIKRPINSHRRQKVFGGMARFIQVMRAGMQKVSLGIKNFLPNLLPTLNEDPEVANSSMTILAIAIPVVIVVIASVIYIQYGRSTQYRQNYEMAVTQAAQARGQTNPTEVRRAWVTTIYYLNQAEKNQKTQDVADLRQEAQTALDNLDGIVRLDFQEAIVGGALSNTIQITRMAATDTDLYLLDSSRGSIIRAFTSSQGYEIDPSFKCGPGQYGTTAVCTLIDIAALPMSNIYNARILAMDASGTLLYCGLADPVVVSLVPPQLGWKNITAFALDSDGKNLYVLDPTSNAVWQYAGNFGQFSDLPIMFFGEQVPQNMGTAIDLASNGADLYLLFQDGHVTSCPVTRFNVVPMRCTDPATFNDTRPERQPGPKINDAIFTQMAFASAPDPSLYLLEPLTRAIYRFSPRSDSLELRGQFRAAIDKKFSGSATAMAINPNRYIFFSVNNQVFFATDVP